MWRVAIMGFGQIIDVSVGEGQTDGIRRERLDSDQKFKISGCQR
jgi:hypothetical protein